LWWFRFEEVWIMYRTIMVPLDRSPFAEQALPYALALADPDGAAVHLALVHYLPGLMDSPDLPAEIFEQADAEVRLSESTYLEELAVRIAADRPVSVRPRLLQGPVVSALQDYLREVRADLIVMSTHGHGGLKRAWLGSVTDALLRRSTTPLLLVRPVEAPETAAAPEPLAARAPFQHVVAAVDGSPIAEQAAVQAAGFAQSKAARLTLLRIVKPPLHTTLGYLPHTVRVHHEQLERMESEATTYVGTLATRLRATGARVHERVVIDYHPADAILREAADLGADLIALGSHGHGGVRRLVIGSVADKVIRGATMPVFMMPAHVAPIAAAGVEEEAEVARIP
jgi:nucleotide-binding universal stress UspA family protein